MATTPTSIGPIGARQINQSLYVGHSDLTTIQSAVTAAASIGGQFVIVIPFDYAGSDTIAELLTSPVMRGVACACAVPVPPRLRSPAPTRGNAASAWVKKEKFRDIAILPSISTASLLSAAGGRKRS